MPPLIAQLLINRGVQTQSGFDAYFDTSPDSLHNPFLLPDMEKAILRVRQALGSKETIGIFGDFDADGITATVLLTSALQKLGAKVIPYIPHRLFEGYGLNSPALKHLLDEGARLVITADCGVTSVHEVSEAKSAGLDMIITDHHMPQDPLPPAVAIVNPNLPSSSYPFSHLAGVGVAFKLIQALYYSLGLDWDPSLLSLVALGTVADVAPVTGENRALIALGLKALNKNPSPGLRALMEEAGIRQGHVDTEAIAFALAPRINAAGRVDSPLASLELLSTQDPERAGYLAHLLQEQNRLRQQLTKSILQKARAEAQSQSAERALLFLSGKDYPSGVVGLAASKLVEEFYRPAIVMELGEGVARGSCRSIPEFNIVAALSQCTPLFLRFGGHPQAAGFTIPSENIPKLEQSLSAIAAEQLDGVDLRPCLTIDATISLSQLNRQTIPWLNRMAPLGHGNPPPSFLSERVQVLEQRSFGSNGDHMELKVRDKGVIWQAIGFNQALPVGGLALTLDLVYQMGISSWGGEERLRLEILDFRPSIR